MVSAVARSAMRGEESMKRVLGCLGVVGMFVGFAACGGAQHVDAAALPTGDGWFCPGQTKNFTRCWRSDQDCLAAAKKDLVLEPKCTKWPFAICVSWKQDGKSAFACTPNAIECDDFSRFLKSESNVSDVSMCESRT